MLSASVHDTPAAQAASLNGDAFLCHICTATMFSDALPPPPQRTTSIQQHTHDNGRCQHHNFLPIITGAASLKVSGVAAPPAPHLSGQ